MTIINGDFNVHVGAKLVEVVQTAYDLRTEEANV